MWLMGKGSKILQSLNATRIKKHSRVRCEVPKNIGGLSVVPETHKANIFQDWRQVLGSNKGSNEQNWYTALDREGRHGLR